MEKGIYVIEELMLDPMENEPSAATYYKVVGYKSTRKEAVLFCRNGEVYTKKDCWAIIWPRRQYRYKFLEEGKCTNT